MADSQRKLCTTNRQALWSPKDDQFIRDNYLKLRNREIAKILNRSRPAVYMRAKKLGCQCGFVFQVAQKTVQCKQCGREFTVRRSERRKYCSLPCAYASKDRIVARPKDRGFRRCAHCNKQWKVTTRNKDRLTYCSHKCWLQVMGVVRKQWPPARRQPPAMVSSSCVVCGKSFQTRKAVPLKTCSQKCRNRLRSEVTMQRHLNTPSSSPQYSNCKAGRRADLGNIFFRSAWEANYARYLNALIAIGQVKAWRHEPRVFVFPSKRGARSYRPDFEVVTASGATEYHEVKGYDHPRGRSCRRKMRRYYPNERLVLIDRRDYEPIAKAFWRVLPGWE